MVGVSVMVEVLVMVGVLVMVAVAVRVGVEVGVEVAVLVAVMEGVAEKCRAVSVTAALVCVMAGAVKSVQPERNRESSKKESMCLIIISILIYSILNHTILSDLLATVSTLSIKLKGLKLGLE